jgi:hypothetical protein
MPGEMTEQIAADIASHCREGEAADIHGKPPQEIVGGDQACERGEGNPNSRNLHVRSGEGVDQHLHAVLGADRAGHRT